MDDFYSSCASSEPFALQVLDDSMEPEFETGCIIIIDRAGVISHGCYVLAKYEGEYIFRQLRIDEGRWSLHALKEGHPVLPIAGKEAIEGVIVQKAGRRRSQHKHYV